jgi:Taurine catabolism dioxygenase TauD, TfdA family
MSLPATISAELSAEAAGPAKECVIAHGYAVIESAAAGLSPEEIEVRSRELYSFGAALGTPLIQSPRRELVEDVKDYSDIEVGDTRGYRSGGELTPHSDPPTLIVLHCVQTAKQGGETSLVRVTDIVEAMAHTSPDLVEELFRSLPDWRVAGQYGIAEEGPGSPRPVLARHNGILSCVLYRPFVEQAAAALGTPLSPPQIAALDLFETCSTSPDLAIRFMLEPGQTLILHNRAVLHARTDYSDWPELHRRRHLLRMWIDSPDMFPVHPDHELGDLFSEPGSVRGPVGV